MSETQDEQQVNAQAEIQPVTTGEEEVHPKEAETQAVSSSPDEKEDEKPIESERDKEEESQASEKEDKKPVESERDNEEKSQATEKPLASPKEEEVAAKPAVAKQPKKLRCFDPTDTVDIAMGGSGVESIKPVTVPQFFQQTFDQLPDAAAMCWKDDKEGPWQSLTYAQYKKLIYNVAKSFLKVVNNPLYVMYYNMML